MNITELSHRHFRLLVLFFAVAIPQFFAQAYAQEFGEVIIKRGMVADDIYMAGAQVDLYATVNGDVVVAGGQLNLEGDIKADVIAAGGTITLRGSVADDARLAGGDIRVASTIGDDLVAAGGRIHLSPAARINGRAWLSGGDIRIDGEVMQELRASGGRIVITGKVNGNAELWAEQIIIDDSAVIIGDLHYKSPHAAVIASGARISGEVIHTPVEVDMKPVVASVVFFSLLLLLSIIVTAVVFYLLFPEFSLRVSSSLRNEPWLSLGVGLAVFAGIPLLMIILFSTAIGVFLALMLLAIYFVLLLTGYFNGAMYIGNAGLYMMGKTEASKAARALALAIALLVLAIFNLVPVIGGLVNWAVLLAGTGALSRQLYVMYRT